MDDLNGRVALVTGASRGIMIQAVLPGIRARQWGRIVNLLSVAAQVGAVVGPHYVNGGWFMS
jgi:3-oxoacyl-[acyl-carrier protein] reductase